MHARPCMPNLCAQPSRCAQTAPGISSCNGVLRNHRGSRMLRNYGIPLRDWSAIPCAQPCCCVRPPSRAQPVRSLPATCWHRQHAAPCAQHRHHSLRLHIGAPTRRRSLLKLRCSWAPPRRPGCPDKYRTQVCPGLERPSVPNSR